jgi:hypothetical protein
MRTLWLARLKIRAESKSNCSHIYLRPTTESGAVGFSGDAHFEELARMLLKTSYIWDFQASMRLACLKENTDPYLYLKGDKPLAIWTPRISFVGLSHADSEKVVSDFLIHKWNSLGEISFDLTQEEVLEFVSQNIFLFSSAILWDMTDFCGTMVCADYESTLNWLHGLSQKSGVDFKTIEHVQDLPFW